VGAPVSRLRPYYRREPVVLRKSFLVLYLEACKRRAEMLVSRPDWYVHPDVVVILRQYVPPSPGEASLRSSAGPMPRSRG
jgi:hypothetical protein